MAVERFYDENADKYIKTTKTVKSPSPLITQCSLTTLISNENISMDKVNIIDIGCGDGTFSRFLCSEYSNINKITAIDLSSKMLQNAKQHKLHSDKISYYKADITKLSTLTNQNITLHSYDIVIIFFVINFMSTKQELYDMMYNISLLLKPNGYVIGLGASPDDYRLINASNQESYNKYGIRMCIENNTKKLYDGYEYIAQVYAFDDSKTINNVNGNFMEFHGYFWSRNIFNKFSKIIGFKEWKWVNLCIPDIIIQNHTNTNWKEWSYKSPDMMFCAKKSAAEYNSKL